jgi:hypothetical protein
MADEKKIEKAEKSRRQFVMTAAQMAVTAPAVVALLSASTKAAKADEHNVYATGLDDPGNAQGDLGGIHGIFGNTIYDDTGPGGIAN